MRPLTIACAPARYAIRNSRPGFPATTFTYTVLGMSQRKIHGKPVSDEQIQAWADEAEAGYDTATLRRRGRPTAGEGPGTVVPVRLDGPTLAALMKRAEEEGLANRSEAIRAAVRAWAHVA
ncbi:hypothetical protein GCM10009751_22380 [Myceligenerans crystallogenes]|uniref:Ribbon-helix-helix protein CopG domain-containing protein n=2 Tax=Myceligenerans crystallogenes TaxID=316335 RepID=A0ABN2NFE5_9MICO